MQSGEAAAWVSSSSGSSRQGNCRRCCWLGSSSLGGVLHGADVHRRLDGATRRRWEGSREGSVEGRVRQEATAAQSRRRNSGGRTAASQWRREP